MRYQPVQAAHTPALVPPSQTHAATRRRRRRRRFFRPLTPIRHRRRVREYHFPTESTYYADAVYHAATLFADITPARQMPPRGKPRCVRRYYAVKVRIRKRCARPRAAAA